MNRILAVSLDLGNAKVKAMVEGKEDVMVMDNFIADAEEFRNDNEIWVEYANELNVYESQKHEKEEYVWGPGIKRATMPISTYNKNDRYNYKPYRLLAEFALAEMVHDVVEEGSIIDLVLTVGVPAEEKHIPRHEADLKSAFVGLHTVKRNGKTVVFRVLEDTFTIMSQPTATPTSMFYSDDLKTVERPDLRINANEEPARIGVIDIGGGTTDLDVLLGMKPVLANRKTVAMAMNEVHDNIGKAINRDMPEIRATAEKVEREIIKNKNRYFVSNSQGTIDIAGYQDNEYAKYLNIIVGEINKTWDNIATFDGILLTGGGSVEVFHLFKEWNAICELVPNAQVANVKGYQIMSMNKKRKLLAMNA
ncbi:ParM/StbA family protein [Bacillus paramycoides]|uniref:ParM/StbA family protein n=1 Tax=Bacillus paramycoides TaxID=2026194 RepID=UPI002E1CF85C|nr:ParM/StbA family protein [Bacillus paramycoides]